MLGADRCPAGRARGSSSSPGPSMPVTGSRRAGSSALPAWSPNSHFYHRRRGMRVRAHEPAVDVRSYAFAEEASIGGDCAGNRVPVVRLYNNGMGEPG